MPKVNCEKWNQTQEELRELGIKAEHPRTRERLIALYEISDGKSATKVGKETGRNPQTVMSWVHKYNQQGISVLEDNHSGGIGKKLSKSDFCQ
ncbi:helix-turn-helix domain-containing protein [Cyanobacterium aponinum]|uniref:Helix-turn-helix domain-containing protein n=1 Tax=Cyanobacterium aponinum 0216 TaxID=2676140 RepID=A0A844GUZ0_9CHRO|nr:helix-turn-helix domain-containing protein [Cyanobacterium aponinum]MTF38882.1 helix-turn-helix domain-containing protein [Cyanobacterium aponinum 0216]